MDRDDRGRVVVPHAAARLERGLAGVFHRFALPHEITSAPMWHPDVFATTAMARGALRTGGGRTGDLGLGLGVTPVVGGGGTGAPGRRPELGPWGLPDLAGMRARTLPRLARVVAGIRGMRGGNATIGGGPVAATNDLFALDPNVTDYEPTDEGGVANDPTTARRRDRNGNEDRGRRGSNRNLATRRESGVPGTILADNLDDDLDDDDPLDSIPWDPDFVVLPGTHPGTASRTTSDDSRDLEDSDDLTDDDDDDEDDDSETYDVHGRRRRRARDGGRRSGRRSHSRSRSGRDADHRSGRARGGGGGYGDGPPPRPARQSARIARQPRRFTFGSSESSEDDRPRRRSSRLRGEGPGEQLSLDDLDIDRIERGRRRGGEGGRNARPDSPEGRQRRTPLRAAAIAAAAAARHHRRRLDDDEDQDDLENDNESDDHDHDHEQDRRSRRALRRSSRSSRLPPSARRALELPTVTTQRSRRAGTLTRRYDVFADEDDDDNDDDQDHDDHSDDDGGRNGRRSRRHVLAPPPATQTRVVTTTRAGAGAGTRSRPGPGPRGPSLAGGSSRRTRESSHRHLRDHDDPNDDEEADANLQRALAESALEAERLRRSVTDPHLDLDPDVSPGGPGSTGSGARSGRPGRSDRVETRVAAGIDRGAFVRECLTDIPDPDDLAPRIEEQPSGSRRIRMGEDLGVSASGMSGMSLLPSSRQRGQGVNLTYANANANGNGNANANPATSPLPTVPTSSTLPPQIATAPLLPLTLPADLTSSAPTRAILLVEDESTHGPSSAARGGRSRAGGASSAGGASGGRQLLHGGVDLLPSTILEEVLTLASYSMVTSTSATETGTKNPNPKLTHRLVPPVGRRLEDLSTLEVRRALARVTGYELLPSEREALGRTKPNKGRARAPYHYRWLGVERPSPYVYIPQVGDEVVFLTPGFVAYRDQHEPPRASGIVAAELALANPWDTLQVPYQPPAESSAESQSRRESRSGTGSVRGAGRRSTPQVFLAAEFGVVERTHYTVHLRSGTCRDSVRAECDLRLTRHVHSHEPQHGDLRDVVRPGVVTCPVPHPYFAGCAEFIVTLDRYLRGIYTLRDLYVGHTQGLPPRSIYTFALGEDFDPENPVRGTMYEGNIVFTHLDRRVARALTQLPPTLVELRRERDRFGTDAVLQDVLWVTPWWDCVQVYYPGQDSLEDHCPWELYAEETTPRETLPTEATTTTTTTTCSSVDAGPVVLAAAGRALDEIAAWAQERPGDPLASHLAAVTQPVPPTALLGGVYLTHHVAHPLSLTDIRKRCASGYYRGLAALLADARLVLRNWTYMSDLGVVGRGPARIAAAVVAHLTDTMKAAATAAAAAAAPPSSSSPSPPPPPTRGDFPPFTPRMWEEWLVDVGFDAKQIHCGIRDDDAAETRVPWEVRQNGTDGRGNGGGGGCGAAGVPGPSGSRRPRGQAKVDEEEYEEEDEEVGEEEDEESDYEEEERESRRRGGRVGSRKRRRRTAPCPTRRPQRRRGSSPSDSDSDFTA